MAGEERSVSGDVKLQIKSLRKYLTPETAR